MSPEPPQVERHNKHELSMDESSLQHGYPDNKRVRLLQATTPNGQLDAKKQQLGILADQALHSLPVFLVQYKLGYDHNYKFSRDGHSFQLTINSLPDHLARIAYEFATSIHPSHANKLQHSMLKARGHFALQLMLGTEENAEEQYTISSLAERTKNPSCRKYYGYVQQLVSLRDTTLQETAVDTTFTTNLISPQERKCIYANPICDGFTIVDSDLELAEFNNMLRLQTCKEGSPDYFFSYVDAGNAGAKSNQPVLLSLFVRSLKHTWVLDLRKLGRKIASPNSPVTLARVLGDPEANKAVINAGKFATALYHHFDVSSCNLVDLRIMQKKAYGKQAHTSSLFDTILIANRQLPDVAGLSWIESARCWFLNQRYKTKDFSAPTISSGALHNLVHLTRNLSRMWTIYNVKLGIRDELEVFEETKNSVDSALSTASFQFGQRRTRNSLERLRRGWYY